MGNCLGKRTPVKPRKRWEDDIIMDIKKFPFVGVERGILCLKQQQKLHVFENNILRKIYQHKKP
jgi:hypothetical protein